MNVERRMQRVGGARRGARMRVGERSVRRFETRWSGRLTLVGHPPALPLAVPTLHQAGHEFAERSNRIRASYWPRVSNPVASCLVCIEPEV